MPLSVSLSAFGVTAAVRPVITSKGVLEPPSDPAEVGWWIAGAAPGSDHGSTILVGHVDGPSGPGAFYRLVHTHAGDVISVGGPEGQAVQYEVTSLQYHAKTTSLPADLFDVGGAPQLVLISCGGTFDPTTDQYADNVIVTATPMST